MTELVVLRAADEAALLAEISRIAAFLDRVPDVPLADVAYTCSLTRGASALPTFAAAATRTIGMMICVIPHLPL